MHEVGLWRGFDASLAASYALAQPAAISFPPAQRTLTRSGSAYRRRVSIGYAGSNMT